MLSTITSACSAAYTSLHDYFWTPHTNEGIGSRASSIEDQAPQRNFIERIWDWICSWFTSEAEDDFEHIEREVLQPYTVPGCEALEMSVEARKVVSKILDAFNDKSYAIPTTDEQAHLETVHPFTFLCYLLIGDEYNDAVIYLKECSESRFNFIWSSLLSAKHKRLNTYHENDALNQYIPSVATALEIDKEEFESYCKEKKWTEMLLFLFERKINRTISAQ